MTYEEERMETLERQYAMATIGFNAMLKNLATSEEHKDKNFAAIIEPYFVSLNELRDSLQYYKKEKAKEEEVKKE